MMPDVRIENEIKMYSPGGPFAYEGNDPSERMDAFLYVFREAGFSCTPPKVSRHTDYYYTDTAGEFDINRTILRYRDLGGKAFLTIKIPAMEHGLGLSRREIEGEVLNDSRFDRWKSVQDYATEHCGPVEIRKVPSLITEVTRGRCQITSEAMTYTFTFDRMIYHDPVSGRRSKACYELEFESLDKDIDDDPAINRLVMILSDRYMFEEEKISKYERGRAFLRSLKS